MTISTNVYIRQMILKANAAYLGASAIAGLLFMDLTAVMLGTGPEGRLIAGVPHAAIGFIEAHGLALILGILFWRAEATRPWHLTGAATSGLLGTANLLFWQIFIDGDALAIGYLTTSLHWTVALAQMLAAFFVSNDSSAQDVLKGAAKRFETV